MVNKLVLKNMHIIYINILNPMSFADLVVFDVSSLRVPFASVRTIGWEDGVEEERWTEF